jgi:CspA family cold shock protein
VFVDSLTNKNELFLRAREWFAKTYKSSMNVIQMEDKENGKIIGKALLKVFMTTFVDSQLESGFINYSISIYIKDGRYKYEITDFYHTGMFINSSVGTSPDGGPCEKLFNEKKGFGFINPNEGREDIFVHSSGLIDRIRENDKVQFETERGQKGINAINVQTIK